MWIYICEGREKNYAAYWVQRLVPRVDAAVFNRLRDNNTEIDLAKPR